MQGFSQLGIQAKLWVITLLASVAALIMVTVSILIYEVTTFQQQFLDNVKVEGEVLAKNISFVIDNQDTRLVKRLHKILSILNKRQEFVTAAVFDAQKNEIYRYYANNTHSKDKTHDFLKNIKNSGGVFKKGFVDFSIPVSDDERWYGTLFLRYHLQPLYKRFADYYAVFLLVIFALIVLAFFINRALQKYLTGPIHELILGLDEVSNRYGGETVPLPNNDELGYITRSFFRMLNQVDSHQKQLHTVNIELEDRRKALEEELVERRQAEKKLTFMARHDALTGLPNRTTFDNRLEELLEESHTEGHLHVLLYMDLDQFKVVNDTCGHVAGDHLLRQITELLRHEIRQGDVLARLGGDEFGILLPYCSMDVALKIANKLRLTIRDYRFSWQDKTFTIGVSIGMVPISPDSESREAILSIADALCYTAKDNGRNCIEIYKGERQGHINRQAEMHWISRINEAMDENRMVLMFQKIAPNEKDNKYYHYEILIRLQQSDGVLIAPGSFLPAAERYNLMPRIDRHVVSKTFLWLSQHEHHLEQLELCSINLSGNTLGDVDFLEFVINEFDRYKIPPNKICFEITETMAVQAFNNTVSFMEKLKSLGCQFALDDFGSGFSSYAYLKNLPVDYLKIDGSFVRDIEDDSLDLAMVKSINEIGHVMGKKTIAEYVENSKIQEMLEDIGVDYCQGYHIGRPEPLDNLFLTPQDQSN